MTYQIIVLNPKNQIKRFEDFKYKEDMLKWIAERIQNRKKLKIQIIKYE